MLIATQGFAALGNLAPDTSFPTTFSSATAARSTSPTPTSGTTPRFRRQPIAQTSAAIPIAHQLQRHYERHGAAVGARAQLPGAWYRRGRVGWGVNVAHQGDILFVTLLTYDTTARRCGSGHGRAPLHGQQATPARSTHHRPRVQTPCRSIRTVAITNVGTVDMTFTDAQQRHVNYTVSGVSKSKPVGRQSSRRRLRLCAAGPRRARPTSRISGTARLRRAKPAGA